MRGEFQKCFDFWAAFDLSYQSPRFELCSCNIMSLFHQCESILILFSQDERSLYHFVCNIALPHFPTYYVDVKFQSPRLTVQWETRAECLQCNNFDSTFTRPHKLVNFHEKGQLISNCSVPILRGNFRNWKMGEDRLRKIGGACGGRVRHVGETRGAYLIPKPHHSLLLIRSTSCNFRPEN